MKKRETVNLALHITVGAALTALVMWHPLFIISVVFVFAWLREQAQHRYIVTVAGSDNEGMHKLYEVEKQTFFGWQTGHRLWEVFQWQIGSALVAIPWFLFG